MTSIRTSEYSTRRILTELAARSQRNSRQLASQKRIATAADDAAGLAIAKRLEAAVRGAAQGERNLQDGQSLVRTADATLQTSSDTIARMRELTIQAQNGTLSAADRDAVQQEYDQLAAQLDQTAGGSNFAGQSLLDGSASGTDAIVLTDGSGNETTIDIGDASAAALGVAGRSVADPNTVAALDQAAQQIAVERARLGATDNALANQQESLAAARIAADEARSRIEDLDVARAIAERTRDRILGDLALAGQREDNRNQRQILNLLG